MPFDRSEGADALRESLDTVRCLDEGVSRSVADANIGSVLGIGFPRLDGGVLQYVNGYGPLAFVERSSALAASYGARLAPQALLVRGRGRPDVYVITV